MAVELYEDEEIVQLKGEVPLSLKRRLYSHLVLHGQSYRWWLRQQIESFVDIQEREEFARYAHKTGGEMRNAWARLFAEITQAFPSLQQADTTTAAR